jgi:hypothetical protein
MKTNEVENDSDCSFKQVLRWPTTRSKTWTCTFVSSAKVDPNIIAIVAIGSAVRPGVSSTDIDLLTICSSRDLQSQTPPIEVDLRTYLTKSIEDKIAQGHDLLTWSIKFGCVLYQTNHYWDKLVANWSDRLPLPSKELARQRASTVYQHFTEVLKIGDEQAAREQAISYLTHLVRAELLERGIFPASRPELPQQLRRVANGKLADNLERLLSNECEILDDIDQMVKLTS